MDPKQFDYWCPTCQIGFYSCSYEAEEHETNPNNKGHDVYDGGRMDLNGQPLGGVQPLYTTNGALHHG